MQQRDWYLKEVQKLTALLARLLGLKHEGRQAEAFALVEEACRSMTGLNTAHLAQLAEESLINLLIRRELKGEQIEALAELLVQEGELLKDTGNKQDGALRLQKAIFLLNYLTESRREYSFEREQRLKVLHHRLREMQFI